jgi:DNA polymerase-3 subunit epsilon
MIASFDTESTGVSTEDDRIVSACIAHVDGTGTGAPVVREWLVDPGIEIPAEAVKVHGITTERARAEGRSPAPAVAEIAEELLRAAGSLVPVVVYNAAYDLTLLDREARRHGLEPFGAALDDARALIIDPLIIDKALDPFRKGKRRLADVAAHYGVKAGEAHSASGDALTAARVAWAIANRNPQVARMGATELMAWQAKARREQARSFEDYLRRMNDYRPVDGSWPWTPLAEAAVA